MAIVRLFENVRDFRAEPLVNSPNQEWAPFGHQMGTAAVR